MHLNYVFPECIAYGSGGGPHFNTAVQEADNGDRSVFIPWPVGRHTYNAQSGVKTFSDYEQVLNAFHVAQGRAHTFDWKDWNDYKTCIVADTPSPTDQPIGTSDGVETDFELSKEYTLGAVTRQRKIQRPLPSSILIAGDGITITGGWTWIADEFVIRFDTPVPVGVVITWGGLYYVPVAFSSNDFLNTYNNKQDGAGGEFLCTYPIDLEEVKLKLSDMV